MAYSSCLIEREIFAIICFSCSRSYQDCCAVCVSIKTTGSPPAPLSVGLAIGRSIFYPHPSKDEGFSNRGVRIFSSKKPTKFGPFNGRFQGNESKVLKV